MEEIAGLMRAKRAKGFGVTAVKYYYLVCIVLLRCRRHFSPWLFETGGRCHSNMPSLFILFIQC